MTDRARLSSHQRESILSAKPIWFDGNRTADGIKGAGYMRRAEGAMTTLRALARRGIVCGVKRLGAAGDAQTLGCAFLTPVGIKLRRELLAGSSDPQPTPPKPEARGRGWNLPMTYQETGWST
jgi:hypothetical protein